MGFKDYFNEFCNKPGYVGCNEFKDGEYRIIISKDDNNAGIFLSEEELKSLSNRDINALLQFLHEGFTQKFQK